MARPLRIEYKGAFHHVTARGNERKRISFGKGEYDEFKEYLLEAHSQYGYRLHCYVLMTAPFPLLIEAPDGNMSKGVHYINGSYANCINRRRNRGGHLLQRRYKGTLVDRDASLLALSRYLHLNRVRVKIVDSPEDYRQSSFWTCGKGKKDAMVTTDLLPGTACEDGGVAPARPAGNRSRQIWLKGSGIHLLTYTEG